MLLPATPHVTLDHLGTQPVFVTFDGPRLVTDAGLLAVRDLDRRLGVLAGLAEAFPDPRAPKFRTHSTEALLTQQVYQLLAGYPDCDDANDLAVPDQKYTFGVVKAAQARGDFEVLAERGRRALRVHIGKDVKAGLAKLHAAVKQALV